MIIVNLIGRFTIDLLVDSLSTKHTTRVDKAYHIHYEADNYLTLIWKCYSISVLFNHLDISIMRPYFWKSRAVLLLLKEFPMNSPSSYSEAKTSP